MPSRKYKMQNVLTFLFLTISALYLGMMLLTLRMIHIFNSVMTAAHTPSFGIIALFPHLLSLPLLFMTSALTFFHLSLKIREGSKLSWILALIFLAALPFPLYRVSYLNINPLINQFGDISLNNSFETWNYKTLTLAGIALLLLVISFKHFIFEGRALQKRSKILLGLFFFTVVLPTLIYCFYIYSQAHNQDFEYTAIKKAVPFHIYKPSYLPDGRLFETVYYIPKKGLLPNNPTVQVDFNYSMNEIMNGKKTGLISVKQSSIDKAFNYKSFIAGYKKEVPTVRTLELKNAKKNTALLKEKKGAKYILFISKYDTLIVISAFYIDNKELIKFAESLM